MACRNFVQNVRLLTASERWDIASFTDYEYRLGTQLSLRAVSPVFPRSARAQGGRSRRECVLECELGQCPSASRRCTADEDLAQAGVGQAGISKGFAACREAAPQ